MDLQQIRSQLSKMTERILMRLHDRAGFPLNRPVYEPGAIRIDGAEGVSLLEYSLRGMEAYHASLGRFDWPDQYPLTGVQPPRSAIARPVTPAERADVPMDIGPELLRYYVETLLPQLCSAGDDPGTYGETAYIDADLLELLHERINIGRKVALAKAGTDPSLWDLTADPERLAAALRDEKREEAVLADVEERARAYGLDATLARSLFRWIMQVTLDLEVSYLRALQEQRRA